MVWLAVQSFNMYYLIKHVLLPNLNHSQLRTKPTKIDLKLGKLGVNHVKTLKEIFN